MITTYARGADKYSFQLRGATKYSVRMRNMSGKRGIKFKNTVVNASAGGAQTSLGV